MPFECFVCKREFTIKVTANEYQRRRRMATGDKIFLYGWEFKKFLPPEGKEKETRFADTFKVRCPDCIRAMSHKQQETEEDLGFVPALEVEPGYKKILWKGGCRLTEDFCNFPGEWEQEIEYIDIEDLRQKIRYFDDLGLERALETMEKTFPERALPRKFRTKEAAKK